MLKSIADYLDYARKHRILVHPETRKIGIKDVLGGWFLIAFSVVVFHNSSRDIPPAVNFIIQFASATLVLFVAGLCNGRGFLKIREDTVDGDSQLHLDVSLNVRKRKILLYTRSVLAIAGYMAFSWAKIAINVIDNSAIFGADAIAYALLMWIALKEKISKFQLLGVVIGSVGVFYVLLFDLQNVNVWSALGAGCAGILSSVCLAIITLMTSTIVRHEPPLRMAFYQCVIGLLMSLVIGALTGLFDLNLIHLKVSGVEIFYSVCTGCIYAIALLLFFEAFLYTEPIVITVLSYSLMPFVGILSFLVSDVLFSEKSVISSLLISIGGVISVYSAYQMNKKNGKMPIVTAPSYSISLRDRMRSLKETFRSGKISVYDYMSQKHEFNKLLFEFSEEMKGTDIEKIDISQSSVLFTILPLHIRMESDGACRSAPLEILNFGKYEPEESVILFKLIKDGDSIFDIGGHIGWYSINFAKRFPSSLIYTFEPIPHTFEILQKNIQRNDIRNVSCFNFGIYNRNGTEVFEYFKGGSALASLVNLIGHDKTERVSCSMRRLDDVIESMQINQMDFLKCDVEGCELAALQGALKTLSTYLPIIYIELCQLWCEKFDYSADDVLLLLASLGYLCFSPTKKGLQRELQITNEGGIYNYFFLHKTKHMLIIESLLD